MYKHRNSGRQVNKVYRNSEEDEMHDEGTNQAATI